MKRPSGTGLVAALSALIVLAWVALKSSVITIVELVRAGGFEAVLTWVMGLKQQTPFRVQTLTGPPRLVVDVAAP